MATQSVNVGPLLNLSRSDGFFEFDRSEAREVGLSLSEAYQSASPYPHVVIEKLFDTEILRRVNAEFPGSKQGRFSDGFSQLKTGYALNAIRSSYIHDLLAALNSSAFLTFLESLTGKKGLVADPHFSGGGLHETRRGGHLSIHSDFNIHPQSKMLRRLNLILFLNEGWDSDWGGELELWDREMRRCWKSVSPLIGRAVIFDTDAGNNHGHPEPLMCPEEVTRRSIALYYYTSPAHRVLPQTTVFKARPGKVEQHTSLVSRIRYGAAALFGTVRQP